jgi:plasmid stabilization system protein ParE
LGTLGSSGERLREPPYVIVYRIDLGSPDELIVLRVPHAAQDRSREDY